MWLHMLAHAHMGSAFSPQVYLTMNAPLIDHMPHFPIPRESLFY